MIIRPEHLVVVNMQVEFNFRIFRQFEINLEHINKHDRANYSASDIAWMARGFIHKKALSKIGDKDYGNERCEYFMKLGHIFGRRFKLVFCICTDRPKNIGIITFHRI